MTEEGIHSSTGPRIYHNPGSPVQDRTGPEIDEDDTKIYNSCHDTPRNSSYHHVERNHTEL